MLWKVQKLTNCLHSCIVGRCVVVVWMHNSLYLSQRLAEVGMVRWADLTDHATCKFG